MSSLEYYNSTNFIRLKSKFFSGQAKSVRRHIIKSNTILTKLYQRKNNLVIQRLLTRNNIKNASELDDETINRINHHRGGGQPLDSAIQARMAQAIGYEFRGVRVHTGPEVADHNRQVNAVVFTEGVDI